MAFKFGAVPFHMWVPDVYEGAPTNVTLFIATAPKLAYFALALRLLTHGLTGTEHEWSQMLAALAVLTLILGNVVAIAQSNLKRMLAYSAISNVGFILLGFVTGTQAGYGAALFYTLVYVLATLGTFGVMLLMTQKGFEADRLDDYKGLYSRDPLLALVMMALMFSTAGVPPFVGFWAKLSILQQLWVTGHIWLVIIAAVVSVIGAFYYLRIVKLMYFDEPGAGQPLPEWQPGRTPGRRGQWARGAGARHPAGAAAGAVRPPAELIRTDSPRPRTRARGIELHVRSAQDARGVRGQTRIHPRTPNRTGSPRTDRRDGRTGRRCPPGPPRRGSDSEVGPPLMASPAAVTCREIELGVVDADAQVRAEHRVRAEQVVLDQQTRRQPARRGDGLAIEGHGSHRRGSLGDGARHRWHAQRQLRIEVRRQPAHVGEVQRIDAGIADIQARRRVRAGDVIGVHVEGRRRTDPARTVFG